MALSESTEIDRIEIVTARKFVQVRRATIIEKDGVELTRTFERWTLECGTLDDDLIFVDTDISSQPAEVQAVCNAVWTDSVKVMQKNYLLSQKQ
tara:strand:+ start:1031 stop:1312 length:282 start_codon:yes stop_codon:yes gene_type:complete